MNELFNQGQALIIGAGGDLPGTLDDARGIASLLQDAGRCAYPPGQVRLRAGADARRQAVLQGLAELAQACTPESTVVVYFSGHGYRVDRPAAGAEYWLLPNGYDQEDLPGTAIGGADFAEKLAAIPARKLLLLLDCCHAGGVGQPKAPGLAFEKAALPQEVLHLLGEGRGRVLVASSKESELSYGGRPFSAFTRALVEALCGEGASQADGYVRAADLALHARQVVPRLTADLQHPVLHFEQADNFAVAYYAGGGLQPKGLPFSGKNEIEPQPGAWRALQAGDIVDTGGGPYFRGKFEGTYVAHDQINIQKLEDRHVEVNAPLSNAVIITGDGNTLQSGSPATLQDFAALLRQMQALLPQAALPTAELAELQEDLHKVQEQAALPAPNKGLILKRLDSLVNFLASAATVAVSAPPLLELGRRALEWARILFK